MIDNLQALVLAYLPSRPRTRGAWQVRAAPRPTATAGPQAELAIGYDRGVPGWAGASAARRKANKATG